MAWVSIETNAKLPPSMQPISYPITENIHVMIITSVWSGTWRAQHFLHRVQSLTSPDEEEHRRWPSIHGHLPLGPQICRDPALSRHACRYVDGQGDRQAAERAGTPRGQERPPPRR